MVILCLVILGLCFGSFVNALVWRVHKQSQAKPGKKSPKELSVVTGRSMCPHCKHVLSAKDLVPVLSWLSLRGKCRYCKKTIPDTPLPELVLPVVFVLSYIAWPYTNEGWSALHVAAFVFWLALLVGFMALIIYDAKLQLLPDRMVRPLTAIAAAFVVLLAVAQGEASVIYGAIAGALVVFGLFYFIYAISGGRWIGGGDVKISVILGFLAGGVLEALLVVFIASLLGTIYIVSAAVVRRQQIGKHTKLPFGPFLLLGAVIVFLYGGALMDWYSGLLVPVA